MNKKRLRIAILTSYLPPIYSGAGKQALRIATSLKQRGHSVFFVTCSYHGLTRAKEINGIKVYDVLVRDNCSVRGHILFGLKSLIVLYKERHHFDILFCPGMGSLIGFLFLAVKLMKKKIVLRMSLFLDNPSVIMKRKLAPYFFLPYHLADAIIAPSTARQKDITFAFPDKRERVVRINNCVDISIFKPVSSEREKMKLKAKLNLDPQQKYVIYVGRIIARKGVEFLIKTWKEVIKQYNNAALILVGPIDYQSKGRANSIEPLFLKLREEITTCGLQSKVIFTGETDKVHEYLRISDAFVFASKGEGQPSALIEAMATGVAPVVIDIKDIMSDIITSGHDGIIVPTQDLSVFSENLLKFLENDEYRKYFGYSARKKIVDQFSVEVVTKKYIHLFSRVLHSNC